MLGFIYPKRTIQSLATWKRRRKSFLTFHHWFLC